MYRTAYEGGDSPQCTPRLARLTGIDPAGVFRENYVISQMFSLLVTKALGLEPTYQVTWICENYELLVVKPETYLMDVCNPI